MSMRRHTYWLVAASILATLGMSALGQDPVVNRPAGIQAITKPSKDVTVSFVRPGRVAEVAVSKGDAVKTGQKIAQEDDKEEQAALAIDKSLAEDDTEVKAEQAVLEKDKGDVDRLRNSSAAATEVINAILEVTVAQARVSLAVKKQEQAKLKLDQSTIAIDKLKLLAPIDGIIAEEFLKAGESADGNNMKVVRIAQLDPLWIEVPVPIAQARKLKKDDAATVAASDGKEHTGKVIVISPVADSASGTLLVRVEMPNPEMTSAGDTVYVRFGALNAASPAPSPVQVGAAGLRSAHP